MIQIISLVIGGVSAWFYLRKNFELNSVRLTRVEEGLETHGSEMTAAVKEIGVKLDGIRSDLHLQSTELVRVTGRHQLHEQRIAALERTS